MIRRSQILVSLLFLLDLAVVALAWVLGYGSRFHWLVFPAYDHLPRLEEYLQVVPVVLVAAGASFLYAGYYRNLMRSSHELFTLFKGCLLLFVVLLGLLFFYRVSSFSRVFALHFLVILILLLALERFLVRAMLAFIRKRGHNLEHALIVGQGKIAETFADTIFQHSGLGIRLHGFVSPSGQELEGLERLGGYEALPALIAEHGIEKVYITLDSGHMSDLDQLSSLLAEEVVDLFLVPDIYHSLNINPEIMDLDGMPLVAMRQSPLSGWNRVLKRVLDILGSLFAILIFGLPMLLVALLVKLGSRGPIFYTQERMGLDGKTFHMLKFRSMRIGADQVEGWTKANDDRVTPVGKFIRKTSLDELPQFFNVLMGSMSLVGPRPERPVLIEGFKKVIPNYMLRHKMKAGITGWAQINGWRGDTSLERRIEYDIFYLTNWSIWFDLKILLLTPIKGFVNKNAY